MRSWLLKLPRSRILGGTRRTINSVSRIERLDGPQMQSASSSCTVRSKTGNATPVLFPRRRPSSRNSLLLDCRRDVALRLQSASTSAGGAVAPDATPAKPAAARSTNKDTRDDFTLAFLLIYTVM